jgi:DNA-directed RNA polymerase subunit L
MNNETDMSEGGMEIVSPRETNCGHVFHCEIRNGPVTFSNALRRILLSDIPTVVIRDVEIVSNTTQMPDEMLRHRVEQLPVNVRPTDTTTIRDAKIELHILPDKAAGVRTIRTNDFAIQNGRDTLLMTDRDFGTPMLFLRVRPGEEVHIRGRLAVETRTASQVCTATTKWHVDPERAEVDRKAWVENGGNAVTFDKFYIQKSFSRNEVGRPDWIDLDVESVGVIPAKELVKMAGRVLKHDVEAYVKEALMHIERGKDGEYRIQLQRGGHTVCALLQEVMYAYTNVNFVSYDIPHPLKGDTVIRFQTSDAPEDVLESAQAMVEEYCAIVEKSL